MSTIPEILLGCDSAEREALVRSLPDTRVRALVRAFGEWAHGGQFAPEGDWRTWVLMAGRGFGKTRAGAEWVLGLVRSFDRLRTSGDSLEKLHIALVAATVDEARRVMVEGESGLLACARAEEVAEWSRSRNELVFADGARATLYSGANPESLRGPQHAFAWCDELAKWRHPGHTWDMLQMGLRCGSRPRALVTTTPRGGCEALKRILADPGTVSTHGTSRDNPHLPEAFIASVERAYGGTRFAREEIEGELIDDIAGSLWPVALVDRCRGAAPAADALRRVVVGVDPPASAEGACGIVVCGLDAEGVGHVLADRSAGGLSPEGWARAVAAAADAHGADRIVAEKNQGGEMVGAVLRSAGIALPVTLVNASRGKAARAEPVAGLFETGRARFAGRFPELEAELAGLVPGCPYAGPGGSPDRADAMVWALWALLIAPPAVPRVHAW
jgi:phage terminase large subunit-like protein